MSCFTRKMAVVGSTFRSTVFSFGVLKKIWKLISAAGFVHPCSTDTGACAITGRAKDRHILMMMMAMTVVMVVVYLIFSDGVKISMNDGVGATGAGCSVGIDGDAYTVLTSFEIGSQLLLCRRRPRRRRARRVSTLIFLHDVPCVAVDVTKWLMSIRPSSQLEPSTWHDEIDDADYGDADVYYGCGRLLPTPTAQYDLTSFVLCTQVPQARRRRPRPRRSRRATMRPQAATPTHASVMTLPERAVTSSISMMNSPQLSEGAMALVHNHYGTRECETW